MFIEKKLNTENQLIALSFRSSERWIDFPPSNQFNPCCLFHRPYYQAWEMPILHSEPGAFSLHCSEHSPGKIAGNITAHTHPFSTSPWDRLAQGLAYKGLFPFSPFCCAQHSWDGMVQDGTTFRGRTCSLWASQSFPWVRSGLKLQHILR